MKNISKNKTLKIVRKFSATPEMVFDMFTEPEAMGVWWTDQTTFDFDLRVSGKWTIIRKDGDKTYTATGEYIEVNRPHQLKYTYRMPQFSPNTDIITVNIDSEGKNDSIMTFIEEGPDIAEELIPLKLGEISESEKEWQRGFDLIEKKFNKTRKEIKG